MCVLVAQLYLTLCNTWTIACQAPLSTKLSRQNTGVGCCSLLQGIFPTQGWNLGLPHCRVILYHLSHQGSPIFLVILKNYYYYSENNSGRPLETSITILLFKYENVKFGAIHCVGKLLN